MIITDIRVCYLCENYCGQSTGENGAIERVACSLKQPRGAIGERYYCHTVPVVCHKEEGEGPASMSNSSEVKY